jgi:hypothetical protein
MSAGTNPVCVYCGTDQNLTDDHVPPKAIFAKPRPNNLITVPACMSCHGATSQDDEYFRVRLGLNDAASAHPDVKSNIDSIFRGLHRQQARGMAKQLLADTFPVPLKTPSGLYVGQRLAFHVDVERIFRVIERTVRGLYYHEAGERIPDGYAVLVHSNETLAQLSPKDLQETTDEIIRPLANIAPKTIGNNAFAYRHAIPTRFISAWVLTFYGTVPFLAVTVTIRDD